MAGRGTKVRDERPMRADARRNNERLLDAARKVFADQGSATSMETIAKQAGVGVGTLYRHFPKRIDIVEAVYRDDVDALVGLAEGGLSRIEPWDALERFLRAYVDHARAKRTFLNELHEAFDKNPELKSISRDRVWKSCNQILRRAQEAGVARTDITGEDLMQLIGPMCINATLTPEQADRVLPLVLDGLRVTGGRVPHR
ncbi:MAG: TetR/AcrR family transcriptional regulator [Acidimicrobiales bacterium]